MATYGVPARRGDNGEVGTYADERGVKVVAGPGLYLGLCLPSPRISARVAFRPFLFCARKLRDRALLFGYNDVLRERTTSLEP